MKQSFIFGHILIGFVTNDITRPFQHQARLGTYVRQKKSLWICVVDDFFNGLYLGVIPPLNAPQKLGGWESIFFLIHFFPSFWKNVSSCMRIESSAHVFFSEKPQSRKKLREFGKVNDATKMCDVWVPNMEVYLTWRYMTLTNYVSAMYGWTRLMDVRESIPLPYHPKKT